MDDGTTGFLLFIFFLFLWALFAVFRTMMEDKWAYMIVGGIALITVLMNALFSTMEVGEAIVWLTVLLFGVILPVIAAVCTMPAARARKQYGKDEFLFLGKFPFVGGLNLPEGAPCMAIALRSRVVFTALGQEYSLPADRIISASVMTKRQMQRQYVSNAGGALAGAMLLGPVGALIGGYAGRRSISSSAKYLIFTYQDGEEIKYIVFDATGKGSQANRFKRRYKERRRMETVKIDL